MTKSSISLNLSKKIILALYISIAVCIGLATIIERYHGTAFVGRHIYGAWWFSALWAVLTVASFAYIMQQRMYKRLAVFLLHISLVVILAGALTTHLFAKRGTVRLRTGIAEINYIDTENHVERFPFSLTLKEFELLKLLVLSRGKVLTRDFLLDRIWGYEFYGETRTVDVHIRHVRQKLGDDAYLIETIRGVGYKMKAVQQ